MAIPIPNYKGNAGLIVSCQNYGGPNVDLTGFQNTATRVMANSSVELSRSADAGLSNFKGHEFTHVVAFGSPALWVNPTDPSSLPLSVCPIGSCVTRLITDANGNVTGAEKYFRVAGAGAGADFAKMHA